jgi:hypothetical protein
MAADPSGRLASREMLGSRPRPGDWMGSIDDDAVDGPSEGDGGAEVLSGSVSW